MKYKYKKFLKAAYINYDEDYCGCGSSTFTKPTVTTPVIVIMGTTAIIACAISGVTIYYTLDGSTPTSSSALYTGTITLTLSCTIKAIAVKPGMTDSEVASESYVHYLTAWRLVGNSTVHTDEYLTQWKVEGNSQIQQYLTQWKVEGNSVVSNPSADLPQGYKKCKYIESHGTEYIELPFGFDKTDEVYLKGAFTRSYSDKHMVAPKVWNDDTNRFGLGCISANVEGVIKSYIGISIGSSSLRLTPLVEITTNILEYEYKDYIGRVGNSIGNYTEAEFGSTTQNLRLFYGYNSVTQCKIYEYRHKKDNTEYHLIPCLDDNDVPCLYDTVSNTAFYNDGTGTFGYELEQPAILSCGDLGQDGKYHVKISNGVDVFDIALDEPLRKVNDVADSIEFDDGVATLIRNFATVDLGDCEWTPSKVSSSSEFYRMTTYSVHNMLKTVSQSVVANLLTPTYNSVTLQQINAKNTGIATNIAGYILIYDNNYNQSDSAVAFKTAMDGVELIYELATPITETIQAPQISVSPTNTYSSANVTPYSAFTYANPLIYSCGDYSDVDGKYHVKISNGVTIYDIPLTEPLRKVNDVADIIEFPSGTEGKALVTRAFGRVDLGRDMSWNFSSLSNRMYSSTNIGCKYVSTTLAANILCSIYNTISNDDTLHGISGIAIQPSEKITICVYDDNYNTSASMNDFVAHLQGVELVFELATPTTEVIQVAPFPVSPTDTYTSANDTPYSAFEYKKNVEIWSCGEYSAIDGKYHILVQPLGGSIADIALDEPLRKVNNVADKIEFVDGGATVTRYIYYVADMSTLGYARYGGTSQRGKNLYRATLPINNVDVIDNNFLCTRYSYSPNTYHCEESAYLTFDGQTKLIIYDNVYNGENDANALRLSLQGEELIYVLTTPTTEVIQVPQIQEAESYSCVISQGAKAVEWSSFETE